jgi:UDP-N-acetylglucosamine 2-epimerase (non-hydrolysing)
MIDTLRLNLPRAVPTAKTVQQAGGSAVFPTGPKQYAVLTLHRPSNVDDPNILRTLLETVEEIGREVPVLFPIHPRTREKIERFGFTELVRPPAVLLLPPLGYLEMLGLMKSARLVLTDSGGIQEETTALGVPCITLRDTTERPITSEQGTNTVVGQNRERILAVFHDILTGGGKTGRIPEFWDGHAAERIASVLVRRYLPTLQIKVA